MLTVNSSKSKESKPISSLILNSGVSEANF